MTTRRAQFLVFLALLGGAAAQGSLVCPAPWRHMPLASKPASVSELDIGNWAVYIKRSLAPHLIGPAIALLSSAILLLSFISWRLIKCCTCCSCVRGPQRRGTAARHLLTSTSARWSKALATAAAIGVLAGSIYGITRVKGHLVDGGLDAIDSVTTFIDAALEAGHSTVDAVQALDNQLLLLKADLQAMGPAVAAVTGSYIQAIDDTHSTLSTFTSFSTDLDSIRAQTVDRITDYEGQFTPMARTVDKWRMTALYIVYGILAGLAVFAAFCILIDWPAPCKPLVLLLLILLLLSWIIVVVFSAVLRVGNDVCVNVEDKLLETMSDSSSFSLGGGSGDAAALVEYYLKGTGDGVLSVLKDSVGLDVTASLDQANATLVDLQDAISSTPALASIADEFDTVAGLFDNVKASVDTLLIALSYGSFHPVYNTVKGYVCCDVLNSIGDTWSGLIVAATFGIIFMLLAFGWIGRMDKLRALGCCHIYSARDYSLEGDGRGNSTDGAVVPNKKGGLAGPPSPAFMIRKEDVPKSPTAAGAIKASRVAPSTSSQMYPSVLFGADYAASSTPYYDSPHAAPPPAVAASAFPATDEAELRAEAERAAALAGQAYAMASQAQSLLDIAARSTSRLSAAAGSPRSPPGASAPIAMGTSAPSWTSPAAPMSSY